MIVDEERIGEVVEFEVGTSFGVEWFGWVVVRTTFAVEVEWVVVSRSFVVVAGVVENTLQVEHEVGETFQSRIGNVQLLRGRFHHHYQTWIHIER